MAVRTRLGFGNAITNFLGPSKEMPVSDFPTIRDVLCHGQLLKESALGGKHYTNKLMASDLASIITAQWEHGNALFKFPVIISEQRVVAKIVELWERMCIFVYRRTGNTKNAREKFTSRLDKLFDILHCKCPIQLEKQSVCKDTCPDKLHIHCTCARESRIPVLELEYIKAQRAKNGSKSKFQLGSIDVVETQRQIKAFKRKQTEGKQKQLKADVYAEEECKQLEAQMEQLSLVDEFGEVSLSDESLVGGKYDPEFRHVETDRLLQNSKQNRTKYPTLALTSMRYGISARATAALATATLIDHGFISSLDQTGIVDHSKIQREKDRIMQELQVQFKESLHHSPVKCILFDGRKDLTKLISPIDGRDQPHPIMIMEEHYSMSSEPGGQYIHHFVPEKATNDTSAAEQVAIQIVDWLSAHGVDQTLQALGGDSTNINTGWKGGTIQFVEQKLSRKLIWLVCFLHTNELPLRHLITSLDGKTNSDHTFAGSIGRALDKTTSLEINKRFKKINKGPAIRPLRPEIVDDLSTDQHYGYRIVNAIRSGHVPKDLENLDCGPVNHSRWLTTANRLCRLYVSKHGFVGKNLRHLTLMVEYIVVVYYPCWFEAKILSHMVDGPRHVLTQLKLVRDYMQKDVVAIVTKYVESGAWFAHSEHILQTLLASDDETERHFAVKIIIGLRGKSKLGDSNIRPYKIPPLNWQAEKLSELISWDKNVYEPVLTCNLTQDEIRQFLDKRMVVFEFPVHGQSIERIVKEVTIASAAVNGFERRDGYIRSRAANRELMPVNNTKRHLLGLLSGK